MKGAENVVMRLKDQKTKDNKIIKLKGNGQC